MITLKHHGAATGVTGSCHELTLQSSKGSDPLGSDLSLKHN